MISAMKTVKQCVQATAFPQTSDPNPSESLTYDSLMHDHIHTSRMHHIRYYYLWVGSALRAMCDDGVAHEESRAPCGHTVLQVRGRAHILNAEYIEFWQVARQFSFLDSHDADAVGFHQL